MTPLEGRPALAEVLGIGDGRDGVSVAPQASPGREVELAAAAALGAGLDPRRAALDAQVAVLDRLLAGLGSGACLPVDPALAAAAAGAPVLVACGDCGARAEGRAFVAPARCPRCGDVDVAAHAAGRLA